VSVYNGSVCCHQVLEIPGINLYKLIWKMRERSVLILPFVATEGVRTGKTTIAGGLNVLNIIHFIQTVLFLIYHVVTAASVTMAACWDVAPC
jgi:hypothetical protein